MLDSVAANAHKSNSSFGWGGAFGTHYWVDRKEQLATVMMIQTVMTALGKCLRQEGLFTFVRWNYFFANPPLGITEAELRGLHDHRSRARDDRSM